MQSAWTKKYDETSRDILYFKKKNEKKQQIENLLRARWTKWMKEEKKSIWFLTLWKTTATTSNKKSFFLSFEKPIQEAYTPDNQLIKT